MLNMLATLAEYERELIVERINAGIAASKQNGTKFGRPTMNSKVIADKLAIAADARAKGRTAEEAARLVGWSRATLYRHQQTQAITAPLVVTPRPSPADNGQPGNTPAPLPKIGAPATRGLAERGVLTMSDLQGIDLNELSTLHGVGRKRSPCCGQPWRNSRPPRSRTRTVRPAELPHPRANHSGEGQG